MSMGQTARLDDYDPNAGFPLSSEGITQRITGRDDTVRPMAERVRNFENSPFGLLQDYYRAAPKDVWKKNDPLPFVGVTPAQIEAQGANFSMPDKFIRDLVVPQSAGDVGLMLATGGVGRPAARVGAGVLGALAEMTDPAQAGVVNKLANPLRAYHGSPHKFDKFDISKIGTGEGAAAYGHGLYFAENPALAEFYRKQLAGEPEINLFRMGDMRLGPHNQFDYSKRASVNTLENIKASLAEDALINQADLVGAPDKKKFVLDLLDSKIADYRQGWPEGVKDALALRSQIERQGVDLKMGPRPGATYEVNIHAKPEQMLDWDKRLTEQPKAVQDFAQSADLSHLGKGNRSRVLIEKYRAGKEQPEYPATGQVLYRGLYADDDMARATETLRKADIPGIKYLDQGSRDVGKGTSNYVVFDDQLIDIMRKYGLAGLTGGAGVMSGLAAPDNYRQ